MEHTTNSTPSTVTDQTTITQILQCTDIPILLTIKDINQAILNIISFHSNKQIPMPIISKIPVKLAWEAQLLAQKKQLRCLKSKISRVVKAYFFILC
jgi:MinD superfamily P-loop ATPase